MEREQAVKIFKEEIRRLVDEEHVVDLFKANCAEELAAVECRITGAISEYLDNEEIMLADEEIPEGGCVALALWGRSLCYINNVLIEDEESFAHRLAKEGGQYGKSIAAQMLDGKELYEIALEDFFSDNYAKKYDEVYAINAE